MILETLVKAIKKMFFRSSRSIHDGTKEKTYFKGKKVAAGKSALFNGVGMF